MEEEIKVYGKLVDNYTRCIHYCGENDIIAIKLKCCGKYYACIKCHNEIEEHEAKTWAFKEFDELAVLCGNCKNQISINTYLHSNYTCPHCKAKFNERCKNHYNCYFKI